MSVNTKGDPLALGMAASVIEIDRLRALNAELVAALEALLLLADPCESAVGVARAAIAKARGAEGATYRPNLHSLQLHASKDAVRLADEDLRVLHESLKREAAACPGTFQPIARVPGTVSAGFKCDACGACVTRLHESGLCAEAGR